MAVKRKEMGEKSRITLRQRLQAAVQSIQWTYAVFWKPCPPPQGELVWSDGYYNGSVKTRKTIIVSRERSPEEHGLQRSDQLRELFENLSASGDGSQSSTATRRPTAALSPEDLTDTEWFYLVCMSCTFDPGTGIPGQAFSKGRPVWLCKANEATTKVFSRALLAKTACIQTVVCIPMAEGVLELGSTELVREDTSIVQHVVSFFVELAKPTVSEPSISSSQSGENGHQDLRPSSQDGPSSEQPRQRQKMERCSAFQSWKEFQRQASISSSQVKSQCQAMLKNVLFRVPHMYTAAEKSEAAKMNDSGGDSQSKSVSRKEDDVNTAHAMLERRRREKLNDRFLMLRNMVPFVTKMDKVSILGDAIEYLRQLQRQVADLEQRNKVLEARLRGQDVPVEAEKAQSSPPQDHPQEKPAPQDMAVDMEPEDSFPMSTTYKLGPDSSSYKAEIQMQDDFTALEIECSFRQGILLDILAALDKLNLDVSTVEARTPDQRTFCASLKAEAKDLPRASEQDISEALQRVTRPLSS
ncbi:basic helix-loop-helix protein A [Selaginella moellendorffii]|uniref:basic helix-loop-helix protein A n=1 Tax=Selaginella moellendorffii TaxID=88036 RepID=UPI000D1C89A8|nr:basic helix-loop-helix protein A [Selaginella moellendorffii]XP_024530386.1 basic helix-loop-helix protein A [Selaginella moellendorffii]|eukprot:XP_024530380.1 basic helix-loop-helix protein A [Selaginella moellendorffii]